MWKGVFLFRGNFFVYVFVFNRVVKYWNYGIGLRIFLFFFYIFSIGMVYLLLNKKSNCGLKKGWYLKLDVEDVKLR